MTVIGDCVHLRGTLRMCLPILTLLSVVLISAVSCLPQVTQLPHYTKLSEQQVRHLQQRGFGPTVATVFSPTANYDDEQEENDGEDVSVASTQVRPPVFNNENYPLQNVIPLLQQRPQHRPPPPPPQAQQVPAQRRPPQPQQFKPQFTKDEDERNIKKKLAAEEEEKEEPDRLSILLPQSRFDCISKNTGYYADEDLGCEVFHYCQDNARHSWICPEGFTFHQVHLICMPPGNDNICEKSSQFHFVNEYLYKPLNLEEHQSKPNVSLRYSDRYYPDSYYQRQYEDEEEVPHQRKHPIRVGLQDAEEQQQVVVRRPTTPVQYTPTIRPEATLGQVFRSPEEVNISLQQRRPQYVTQRYINQNLEYQ